MPPIDRSQHQLIELWLGSSNYASNTKRSYRRHVSAYLQFLDDRDLQSVSVAVAARYKESLTDPRPGKPKISTESANAALIAIKAFHRWYTLTRCPPGAINPWGHVLLHKPAPLESLELPLDEFKALQDAAIADKFYGPRDALLLELLRHGLRAGEVLALNMASFRNGRIFIATSKTGHSREIGMLPSMAEYLDDYLSWRQTRGFPWEEDSPLILSLSGRTKGERLSYAALYKRFNKLVQRSGLKTEASPHWLRHLFSSDLLRRGIPPAQAMLLTGHKSAKTFKRYTIAIEQDAAISAFEKAYLENP